MLPKAYAPQCADWRQLPVQVMTWELLTNTKFFGTSAEMTTVVDRLLGKQPLASELPLTDAVRKGLGNPTFRETVVAMLSRDAAQRPTMPELVQKWTGMVQQTGASAGLR